MRKSMIPILFLVAASLVGGLPAAAQSFGKNKINYGQHDWKTYRSPHYDVHYYFDDDLLLEEIVSEAESGYADFSQRLGHEIRQRIPMVLYSTQAAFQRTNIQPVELPGSVLAFAEPFMFRLVLPVDTPPDQRYKTMRHEIAHIFQFDILFGGSLQRTVRGSPPLWFMEGMASYLADDEDTMAQMAIRDAVVNNLLPSINEMSRYGYLTYRYGHAVFDFIEQEWGDEGLRSLLFEVKKALLARNMDKVFRDAFGIDVQTFDRRFARYLRRRYLPILTSKRSPDEYGKEIGLRRPDQYTFSPALSPSGDLVAAIGVPSLEADLLIFSAKDGKLMRNLTRGFTTRWDFLTVNLHGGKKEVSWSPNGNEVAVFAAKEDHRVLLIFDPLTGRRIEQIPFKEIAAVSSPAYSPDGQWIAFSGNRNGQWDIFRYNLETGAIENLTDDPYVDSNPAWSADGKRLLYNRRIGGFEKIFVVEVGAPERKTQLTVGAASDLQPVFSIDGKFVYFSSDRGLYGVFNLHRLELATARIERLTDLVGGAFAPIEMPPGKDGAPRLTYSAYYSGTFRLFLLDLADEDVARARAAGEQEPRTSPLAPSRRSVEREKLELIKEGLDEEEVEQRLSDEIAAAADADAEADLTPFAPPLELTIDPENKEPYRRTWKLDRPVMGVGLADNGVVLADFILNWSDLLGDRRIFLRANSYDGFTDTTLGYINLGGRMNWGGVLRDFRDYYVTGDPLGVATRLQRRQRYTSASAFASYPFNRYLRAEGALSYTQSRLSYPQQNLLSPVLTFVQFSDDYPSLTLDLVGDTARYQRFGPFQGHRFRVGVSRLEFVSGDRSGQAITNFHVDYRAYKMVTRRSVLALWLYGIKQDGERGNLYTIGGINQLRGFAFRDFVGENVAVANLEFRFPLVDALRWGYGGISGPIRGTLFISAGSAWFEDELVFDAFDPTAPPERGRAVYDPRIGGLRKFRSRVDGLLVDIHVSAGYAVTLNFLGLPLTWSYAKIWNGQEFGPKRTDFFISYDW